MTNAQDTNDRQHHAHGSRGRSFPLARLGFAVVAMVFLTGSTRSCGDDMRPATITCKDLPMRIEPGTCAPISNPCNASGRWLGPPNYDGFELCH